MYASHEMYAQFQLFGQIQHFGPMFLKDCMQKHARRDACSCQNNAIGSALERWGLGTSFKGYHPFVEALDVSLSDDKEHVQP